MTEVERSENEREIQRLRDAVVRGRKTLLDWVLHFAAVAALAASVVALTIGVANIAAQKSANTCQASLLENIATQNDLANGSRADFRALLAAQAADIKAISDALTTGTYGQVGPALADYQQVTAAYIAASQAADEQRRKHPTTFRC